MILSDYIGLSLHIKTILFLANIEIPQAHCAEIVLDQKGKDRNRRE